MIIGCQLDPIAEAERMAAAGNYSAALDVLNQIEESGHMSRAAQRLILKARFAENETDSAWNMYSKMLSTGQITKSDMSSELYKTAEFIIREKQRTRLAVMLLDSCVHLDSSQTAVALNLAWDRGIEYLDAVGGWGYYIMDFAVRHDPNTMTRLRSRNTKFVKRYEEYQAVDRVLDSLYIAGVRFERLYARPPKDIDELMATSYAQWINLNTEKWIYAVTTDPVGKMRIEAQAKRSTTPTIPEGTALWRP